MKRIVDGVTYNTVTSTTLATARWGDDSESFVGVLYQTRGGAYFVHEEETHIVWVEREEVYEERVVDSFTPLSAEKAQEWMMTGDIEIFNNPFDDPPEATAEAESGSTIYIRVPASLKRRVDEAAKESELSGNAWAMRCLERCLEGSDERRGADSKV